MQRAVTAGLLFALGLLMWFGLVEPQDLAGQAKAPPIPGPPAKLDWPGPLSTEEALKAFHLRPGLKIELVVAEPLVMDPVDIAWGPDGKLWVVEMGDYPLGVDGKGKPGGRIKFLESTTGDGKYDKATVFLDNIPFPDGVMPWRKGVLVTAAPSVFYAEDTDGDGKADVRKDLYVGFGEGNQQHRVNGLRWGLDNWIYIANGGSNGKLKGTGSGQTADISGRDLRIRPDANSLDPQTGRSQFGRNRDDWDNWFGGDNSNPTWHDVLRDHYLRRNPHVAAPKPNIMISVAPGAAPVYPASRTLQRFNDLDRANRFTSACSTMIYRDELLGPEFAGNNFVCEPVHNLVHREIVTPKGVTFSSRRAADEQKSEFLASTDNWFRPAVVRTGPDGALWVVDMYRQIIEHPEWIPQEWQKVLDLRAGHDKGRIYRIYSEKTPPRVIPKLDRMTTAELVQALDSPNGWQRDMAQQLLLWKADKSAVELLRALALKSKRPLARVHALCTLEGLGSLTADEVRLALKDESAGVRKQALRLSEPFAATMGEAMLPLLVETDAQVQVQLAFSLGAWRDPRAGKALAKIGREHATDPYMLAAVLSSLNESNIAEVVAELFDGSTLPPAKLTDGVFRSAAGFGDGKLLSRIVERISTPTSGKFAVWQLMAGNGFLAALETRPALRPKLLGDKEDVFAPLFAQARTLAEQDNAPEPERVAAIGLLARAKKDGEKSVALLAGLLGPRQAPAVQEAALASLAELQHDAVPGKLVEAWGTFTTPRRQQALNVLLSRRAWTMTLMDAIAQGKVPASHLDAGGRQRLLENRDTAIRSRAEKVLAGTGSDRAKVLQQFRNVLEMKGDTDRGKEVFGKRCAVCHQLDGVGKAVGPDLAGVKGKTPEAMLEALLDPNKAVEAPYISYIASTLDGRVFTGLLTSETGTNIVLKGQEGEERTLLRSEIEELRSTGKSLMPEGLENDLTRQQIADVLAYIITRPVPKE